MKKGIYILSLCLLVLLVGSFTFNEPFNQSVAAANPVRLIVDGRDITSLSMPYIENNRTFVPIRFIAEELGAEVLYNHKDRTVSIEKGDSSVLLRIDSLLVEYEDGEKTYSLSDVAPRIKESRTFVPLRLVSNALGIHVEWENDSRTVYVDSTKEDTIAPNSQMKIISLEPGQVITGRSLLEVSLGESNFKNAAEIKYLLLDEGTTKGVVIARGDQLTAKYNWIPSLEHKADSILVAAVYDKNGGFLAGDAIPVKLDINPEISLTGLVNDQIVDKTLSIGGDVNFVASYVKYTITNLDKNKTTTTTEQDPEGSYTWSPMMADNGSYSVMSTVYDHNGQAYESETINFKVEIKRNLGLLGVTPKKTIDQPVTLLASRNFDVSETQYILRDPVSGAEEILATIPYGGYKWFPGPEYSGTKELLVRVKDGRGVVHDSPGIEIYLTGTPKLFLDGVASKQVVSEPVKLKARSNVNLDSVNYILINDKTGARKTIASRQDPSIEYTYSPSQKDNGNWRIVAEGTYDSGKKVVSEEISFKIYFGETYSSVPIIEKDKFLGLASDLARESWDKTGMSASLQTAQAILETGWGQKVPVDKYSGQISYNLFGMKGKGTKGSVTSNTWEEYNGVSFRIDADFRAYNNINESWYDHKDRLLTLERYQPLRDVMYDSTLGAWALRRSGYATDSQYPIKLMNIIKQYNLQELDKIGI